ncbi:MAG: hypothetical protein FJX72_07305 [Armatimonadetes bacterium]|nr:hypothetical protein [Armatimonadota bacterium]
MPRATDAALRRAADIASLFAIPEPAEARDFPDKGNMSHEMYLIVAGPVGASREYLLQRMNNDVFTDPHRVVSAMQACTAAQQAYMANHVLPGGAQWEMLELVPAEHGGPILEVVDESSINFWRMMVRIKDCKSYKSLNQVRGKAKRLQLAEEAGRGLALFGDLTSGIDVATLTSPLPGYRDTRVYFAQLDSVLSGSRTLADAAPYLPEDAVVRHTTQFHFLAHLNESRFRERLEDPELQPFIDLALESRELALKLLRAMDCGAIRRVAIHGDTKLDNFLFDEATGRVRALVDLDTIMPHTWLADWGDMARSLVNVVGEKEPDLSKVRVELDVFRALARGFLSTAREITEPEIELMVDAVQILALELGVRFLADYLRGDSYFQVGAADPPDINKTRAKVQLTLYKELTRQSVRMRRCIADFRATQ